MSNNDKNNQLHVELDNSQLIIDDGSSSKQEAIIPNRQNKESHQPMKEKDLEIFKAPTLNHKTQKQDTGQIPSPSNKAGDQTTSQTNSE